MIIKAPQPIRWQIDDVVFDYSGLVTTKNEIDLSAADRVDGFAIQKTAPLNTDIKVVLYVNNVWCKITGFETGALAPVTTQSLTAESVLEQGNTVADLERFTSLPELAGKKIKMAIALWAEDPDIVPQLKLALKCRSAANQYTKTITSEMYPFAQESELTSLTASTTKKDGGTVDVVAKVKKANGEESDWAPLATYKGQLATAIQFKGTLAVTEIGKSLAQLSTASAEYSPASGIVGAGTVDIVSITENWNIPLASVRMVVRHKRLQDSILRGHVAFRTTPVSIIGEALGVGTGELASYDVQHKAGIHQDTVKVYFDSARQYSGYEVNAASGRIHCTAPEGCVVSVDYEYGWNMEIWQEMANSGTRLGIEYDTTEYRYTRPLNADPASICATKITMETIGGSTEGEELGIGTGAVRTYLLGHIARAGTMTVFVDGQALPSSAWVLAEDGKSIRVSAAKKAVITADYNWISETPQVYQFASLFAE